MLVVEVRPIESGTSATRRTGMVSTFGLVKPGTTQSFTLTLEDATALARELTKTANRFMVGGKE